MHELLELAKALAVPGAARRAATASPIMTCSGGDSAQGADEAARLGLELPALAPATCERLRELLPPAATVANPLDYTAMIWGDGDALRELVGTVGEDPAIDQVLVFYDQPPGLAGAVEVLGRGPRRDHRRRHAAPGRPTMICSTLPELLDDDAAWRFVQSGIPAVAGLRTGLRCAAALRTPAGDPGRLREIAARARGRDRVRRRGRSRGCPSTTPRSCCATPGSMSSTVGWSPTPTTLCSRWRSSAGDIALKLSSAAVQHKSELGGVASGSSTRGRRCAARSRGSQLAAAHGGVVLAERMAAPGVELIVAARTDAVVPALVWARRRVDRGARRRRDRAAAGRRARIERALRSLRGAPLLTGGRGRAASTWRRRASSRSGSASCCSRGRSS